MSEDNTIVLVCIIKQARNKKRRRMLQTKSEIIDKPGRNHIIYTRVSSCFDPAVSQRELRRKKEGNKDKTTNNRLSSLGCPLEDRTSHHTSSKGQTTHNRNTHQTFLGHLLINQRPQTGGLQVGRLLVQQEVVVAAGLAIVPELVVSEGEVVEAFSSSFGGGTEDLREQPDSFLLIVTSVGFDQTLDGQSDSQPTCDVDERSI